MTALAAFVRYFRERPVGARIETGRQTRERAEERQGANSVQSLVPTPAWLPAAAPGGEVTRTGLTLIRRAATIAPSVDARSQRMGRLRSRGA